MNKILKFLVSNLSFLYEKYGFKFVDSESSNSFGGNGYVTLESETMQVRIVNDRDQLFLEFRSNEYDKYDDWHSSDIVYQFISNQILGSSLLDSEIASMIHENFDNICKIFYSKNAQESILAFNKLERERSKRIFS